MSLVTIYDTADETVEFTRKGRSARQRIGDRKRAQKLRGKPRRKSYLRTAANGAVSAIALDSVLHGATVYNSARKGGLSKKVAILSAKNVAMSRLRPHNLVGTAARGAFQNVSTRVAIDSVLRNQSRKRGRFSGEAKNIITFKKSRTAKQRAGDLIRASKLRGRKKRKGISGKTAAVILGGGAALGLGAGYAHNKLDDSPVARELIRVGLSAKDKYYQHNKHSPIVVRTEYDDHHGIVQRGKSAYLTARDVNRSRIESAKIAWKTMGKQLERGKKNNPSKSDLLEKINQLKRR